MPKYKVTYWPGSASVPAMPGDQIERDFPAKVYYIEANNFREAQGLTIHGLAGATSDGCLIEEVPASAQTES